MSEGKDRAMPKVLKALGDKAIERHERRCATPPLKIDVVEGKWWFSSPYQQADEDHWTALMFEAFATRSQSTFRTFMGQLANLVSADWNKTAEAWHPSEDELIAAVQIVRSIRPRNESEACLAAQMVAVHLMQMKLSAQALTGGWAEPRTCAIAAKLARTYATQLETMAKLKGRGSRQRITVKKQAYHEHKHIHLHQGDVENGNQAYEPRGVEQKKIEAPVQSPTRSTLLGSNEAGNIMSMPGNPRQRTLPPARRSARVRGAEGIEERCLPARSLDDRGNQNES